jgi:hypothetical protein
MEPPSKGHVSVRDWWGTEIIVNTEGPYPVTVGCLEVAVEWGHYGHCNHYLLTTL